MPLETFAPRTRLRCCGTCRGWMFIYRSTLTWCPELQVTLPNDDLTSTSCQRWAKDDADTFSIELYDQLSKAGAE